MENKRIDPAYILIAIMIILVAVVVSIVLFQFRTDEVRSLVDANKEVPVILLVEDEGRIIVSHLLILNAATKRIALLEIPDNLGAIIGSLQRVDSFGALFSEKGFPAYLSNLESLLDYKILFWIRMDLKQVGALVDFLGGLEIFVPDSIDVKEENGTYIRVANGLINLDGDKIQDFLRFRDEAEREQEVSNRRWSFTKSLLMKLGSLGSRANESAYKTYLGRSFVDNLEHEALVSWIENLSTVNFETMLNQRILGTVRSVETESGNKELLFPHLEGKLVKESLRQMIGNLALASDAQGGNVRIEILNGTDVPGQARKAHDIFINYGYEVVRFGNATTTDYRTTQVIDRRGDLGAAERAAAIIRATNVSSQMMAQGDDPATAIDVTIILGEDFDGWYVRQVE